MKPRCLFAVMLACACVACTPKEEPKSNQLSALQLTAPQLVGVWYETEKGENEGLKMKSLAFTGSGSLIYRDIADRSLDVEFLEPGKRMSMRYTVADDKLCIASEPDGNGKVATSYATRIHLQNDILTIDSFPEAGPRAISFRLQKAKQIPQASLNDTTKERLKAIFDASNPLLFDFFSQNGVKALTKEDLQSICPLNVTMPEIDFEKQTILFVGLKCTYLQCNLYYNQRTGLYEFVIERGESCADNVYAFSVLNISPDDIKRIDKFAVIL